MHILDLPVDVILLILPCLDVASFISFTTTCRALHDPVFIHDSAYWSSAVRLDFRVPNQPVAAKDGARWHKMYRRLRTQSRIYTWGENGKGCLGHSYQGPESNPKKTHIGWPGEMLGTEALGVISDLQCGGWSTTLLTARGALYTVGVMDADHTRQQVAERPSPLQFPSGFPRRPGEYDARIAIKQFHAGRGHVLGLSDSGRIWSWCDIAKPGYNVKFLSHDMAEIAGQRGRGKVHKVVAGYNKSAALIEGTGIVVWRPELTSRNDWEATSDTMLVMESEVVPHTYHRSTGTERGNTEADLPNAYGEVLDFIVLEKLILFCTSLGKVFAAQIHDPRQTLEAIGEPVELIFARYQVDKPLPDDPDASFATSIQGSFRSFAIFTRSGSVLTGDQDRIMHLFTQEQITQLRMFDRIPALQNNGVISLAFGDYHYHALHSTGHITSYGTESNQCGALGLGGPGNPEARLRGIRSQRWPPDGYLVPHAYTNGRQVWFEEEKRRWIEWITSGGADAAEAAGRVRLALGSPGIACQGEVSEWIEQEGRDWEQKFGLQDEHDEGLVAYFALSVTAAGWHSGALVLVNEDLAAKVKRKCEMRDSADEGSQDPTHGDEPAEQSASSSRIEDEAPTNSSWTASLTDYAQWFLGMPPYNSPAPRPTPRPYRQSDPRYGAMSSENIPYAWSNDHFPRLRLIDGTEMPGTIDFHTWRFGRPDFRLDRDQWI